MGSLLRIALAQFNMFVGNLESNFKKIIEAIQIAKDLHCDLIAFPEMALTGYPIQDLIFDADFYDAEKECLLKLAKECVGIIAIVGGFDLERDPTHHPKYQNIAFILGKGKILTQFQKRLLPTYDVFDEKRYFWSGDNYNPIKVKGLNIGIAICEDLWDKEYTLNVADHLVTAGAQLIISINASPYYIGKQTIRENLVQEKALKYKQPVLYLNMVGGEDELVFDGRSFVIDRNGKLTHRGPFCKQTMMLVDIDSNTLDILSPNLNIIQQIPDNLRPEKQVFQLSDQHDEIIEALSMNLRDYYDKTGIFERIVLGVSGGIDSSFTAYICARALGPEKVTALLMPSRYSSKGSLVDGMQVCKNLGISYKIIPIKESHDFLEIILNKELPESRTLADDDIAHQNLQARLRGTILMFYSNKYRALLVSTGNKSEIATGFCTLYGDTNGGKNVPGDLYKMQVYDLCQWINREKEIIPKAVLEKPPSPELKPNQKTVDNLPPYPILDEILTLRIDEGLSPKEIITLGKDPELVYRVERLYTSAEYKRAQLVQTIKVNKKTFGMGRKIPVLKRMKY